MSSAAFVRKEMIGAKPPPGLQVGPIKWVQQNLFSSWLNTALTVISVLFVGYLLAQMLPWMIQSSWTATSLAECRVAIQEAYGEGTSGACWAVVRDRYLQLIYGFYPKDGYWRLNLTFVLLLVALSPVLFTALPRAMLWFSGLYPFLAVWLLWGGSIWFPLTALFGFILGFGIISYLSRAFGVLLGIIVGVLVTVIYWLLLAVPLAEVLQSIVPISLEPVDSAKFGGFLLSVTIGVTGIGCSLPIGILLALGRISNLLIVKALCVGFIEFIRGVPLITLLFVASTLLNIFLPPGTNFDLILRVIIMVTLFASAYIAEVVRGGLASLPSGQFEAADSLGLDYWKSMRLVVLPQALKVSIPGIVSTFIGLFKDTTLVSLVGLLDPIGVARSIFEDPNWIGIIWEVYVFIAVMFFVFCFAMSRYSMYLEQKLQTEFD